MKQTHRIWHRSRIHDACGSRNNCVWAASRYDWTCSWWAGSQSSLRIEVLGLEIPGPILGYFSCVKTLKRRHKGMVYHFCVFIIETCFCVAPCQGVARVDRAVLEDNLASGTDEPVGANRRVLFWCVGEYCHRWIFRPVVPSCEHLAHHSNYTLDLGRKSYLSHGLLNPITQHRKDIYLIRTRIVVLWIRAKVLPCGVRQTWHFRSVTPSDGINDFSLKLFVSLGKAFPFPEVPHPLENV